MPIIPNIQQWIPGVTKLSTGATVPETSIVFPESVVHPSITDPNTSVQLQEEEALVFLYSLMQHLYRFQETTADSDIPPGFTVRRVFSLDSPPDQGIVRWTMDIPVETALLFGRRAS